MQIRPARRTDLPALWQLCLDHAAFEGLTPPRPDAAEPLAAALWGTTPRAWCLVVDNDDELAGYASYSLEFATWTGREHVHMDCLYLREAHRGKGLGDALLRAVTAAAAELGVEEVQWQTPDWNTDAIGFYLHHGATARRKTRFILDPRNGVGHP